LLVAPMLVLFVLGLLERVQRTGSPYIALVILLIVFMTHARRQDSGFLRLLNYSSWQVFLLEYSIAVLPFSMLSVLVLGDWINPLLLQLGAMLIAFLPAGFSTFFQPKGGVDLNWIPTRFFELKCALRKDFKWAMLLYLIGLATSMFTVSMPLVLLLFMLMGVGAYDPIENRELLELAVAKKKWLPSKIVEQLMAFHLAMLPLYLLFVIFHFKYWYILAAVMAIGTGLLIFAISYKYAHYYPGRKRSNSQLPTSIFLLFLILPFLAPVTLVYLWIYYRRANRNMKLYY